MSQGVISSEAHKMERLIVQLETGIGNWLSDSSNSTCAFVNRWPRNLFEGNCRFTEYKFGRPGRGDVVPNSHLEGGVLEEYFE